MLASEHPATRVHAGGGISVRVNGTSYLDSGNSKSDSLQKNNGNADSVQFGGDADTRVESKPTSWANATITWSSGAQPFTGSRSEMSNANAGKTAVMTVPQKVAADTKFERKTPAGQLVHVIRVQSTTPNLNSSPAAPVECNADMKQNQISKNIPHACIRIKSHPGNFYQENGQMCENSSSDKISVVVRPSLSIIKSDPKEDERSSSGASSAPGSDCERSDSDREGDDGTDSGFSLSRRACASIVINAKNSLNLKDNAYSVNSSSVGSDTSNADTKKVPVNYNDKGNVKLTIASYADKNLSPVQPNGDVPWDMQFHLREFDSSNSDKKQLSEDVQMKIAAAHALLSGEDGTYTLKNKVRSSIVSLLVQSASNRNYDQEEVGRVVFYTTSMGVVRNTFERCRKVRKILETLMVKFEERDVFMNRGFQQEVRERLGTSKVIVPQLFVEGRHLGGVEVLEQLNEIGHLREFLRPYKRQSVGGTCQQCGGYRYLLCPICGGSKKSVTHRHHFSEDLVALRCVTCDESGLIRCSLCINGEV